ncbi:MAG TPA: hypothetical protein VFD22_12590 [Gemmatimonadaceae bacterium]|jgi:hypothetical protein|nr:hypothetical protein [Gemmatimonadaceae bacterium]
MPQSFRTSRSLPLLAAGLFAIAACSKKDDSSASSAATENAGTPAASNAQVEGDLADVTKYRLTMDKIDKFMAAQKNLAAKAASMTPAQREAMEARNDDSSDPNASLDDMAKRIEAEPVMASAIKDAGLSPREFATITISLMQTGMAAAVLKMRPSDNRDSLIREMKANPDNIKFYTDNEAEITRKSKALEDEMKKAGISQ